MKLLLYRVANSIIKKFVQKLNKEKLLNTLLLNTYLYVRVRIRGFQYVNVQRFCVTLFLNKLKSSIHPTERFSQT